MPPPISAFDAGTIAAGVPSRAPQLTVHQSALALRQLLDDGVSPEDPRCLALLQLVNTARFILLPNSNNAAKIAHDLTSKAVHMDVSTASMAAIMGLKNAAELTGAAVTEVANLPPRPSAADPSPERLTLKLLPRPSQKATDALISLVRSDADLGSRARNEAMLKSTNIANKLHKLRAGQRHASVRKQRLAGATIDEPVARIDSDSMPELLPSSPPPNGDASFRTFPRFILPRRRPAVYSTPVPLPLENVPPSSSEPGISHLPGNRIEPPAHSSPTPGAQNDQPSATLSGLLPHGVVDPDLNTPSASLSDKGVMNDTIGTPSDVMEAFMHPLSKSYEVPQDSLDNPTMIRAVLAERERILYRLLKRRQSELAAIPMGMTEQTRRKAIIEAKELSLLDLQRVARYRVCAEMKKMYSLAVQEEGTVPGDHLSRLFRRRDPPIYSYTDGYPRITRFDGIAEMQRRPPGIVAQDSVRMAQFDKSRMQAQKLQRKRSFNARLVDHFETFQSFHAHTRSCRLRIWKGFERYFLDKKRAEEKRRKTERIERLRLLRSNDEGAYLKLLKDTKNERLLQLVRQTDTYLMRIGAQVEKSRVHETGDATNTFVDELQDRDQVPIDAMRRRRDLYYTVTHSVQEEVRQPSIMVHGTLKPYQVDGLKWMVSLYNNNLNGILADEMGLGKTIQTISLITYLVESKKNPGPYLIIVPLSTLGNWIRELDLWAPSLVKIAYRGDRNTRRTIQQKKMARNEFNVLLTTYEFTVKDQHVLSRIQWQYIIIDEGHRMKNANCKLAMTLGVKYRSRNRLLLTGTPLQNNLTELWALLNFLLPTIFSSADTFEAWFKQPFESTTLGDTAELEEEETLLIINRLHQVLRPFLLRRLKTDVESQLPEKVEHVIRCDMSAWQRVLYRQVQGRVGLATGANTNSFKAYNNLLMQCKKICNHPYLFYQAEAILDMPSDYLIRTSGKFFLLQHMLPKLRMHGHRTLIFSQMTAALDYLEDFLTVVGIQYMRLDGNTRADDRQELLNTFNAKDSPFFCFLLSTRAGGLGLNLQTADTVIIFDSDWNPMMDLQAQDRAHRIGQTKVVRVYRLICSGTVEVKILDQANRKLQVDAQVIQAGQFNNQSTETDRQVMLKNILRQKSDEGDELGAVPGLEELNRLFARSEEEFESFCKFDEESKRNETFKPLFEDESELPSWVVRPDADFKTAEEREKENLLSHGRGRRQRKQTRDLGLLTEAEWVKVVEGDLTVDEAFERRKKRASIKSGEKEHSEADSSGEEAPFVQLNENASARESQVNANESKGISGSADTVVSPERASVVNNDEAGENVQGESPSSTVDRISRHRISAPAANEKGGFVTSMKRPTENGRQGSPSAATGGQNETSVLLKLRLREPRVCEKEPLDKTSEEEAVGRGVKRELIVGSSVPRDGNAEDWKRKRQRTEARSPSDKPAQDGEECAVECHRESADEGDNPVLLKRAYDKDAEAHPNGIIRKVAKRRDDDSPGSQKDSKTVRGDIAGSNQGGLHLGLRKQSEEQYLNGVETRGVPLRLRLRDERQQ